MYFDVTVDELLGVDSARIEEKINAYIENSEIYMYYGEVEKNLKLWEEAYEEFPNDCRVMGGLMYAILSYEGDPVPEETCKRIAELGEVILRKSTDNEQRESAIQAMCYAYQDNDREKALQYANMGGSFNTNKDELRSSTLDGEEGVKACQEYIQELIRTAAMKVLNLTTKKKLTYEEMIEAYSFAIDITKRLYADGNLGFDSVYVSDYYLFLADCYAEHGDVEKALDALQESCRLAIAFDALRDTDFDYTSLMVNRLRHDSMEDCKNYQGNKCKLRLKSLENKKFDCIRERKEFRRMLSELKKYAQ